LIFIKAEIFYSFHIGGILDSISNPAARMHRAESGSGQ